MTRKVGGFTSLAQAVVERKLPALGFPQQVAVLGHGVSAVDRSLPVAAAGSGRPEIARTVRIARGAVCGFVLGLREKCDYFEKCYWFLTLTQRATHTLTRTRTHSRNETSLFAWPCCQCVSVGRGDLDFGFVVVVVVCPWGSAGDCCCCCCFWLDWIGF